MLSKIRKWREIDPYVKKMDWDALLAQTAKDGERFANLIADIPASAGSIRIGHTMTIRDMIAHVTDMNYAIANIIDALGQGKSLVYQAGSLYQGAGKRSLETVIQEHKDSLQWIKEAAAEPISSLRKNIHHIYGELSSREWLALLAIHYEYHLKQMEQILASEAYRSCISRSKTGSRSAI